MQFTATVPGHQLALDRGSHLSGNMGSLGTWFLRGSWSWRIQSQVALWPVSPHRKPHPLSGTSHNDSSSSGTCKKQEAEATSSAGATALLPHSPAQSNHSPILRVEMWFQLLREELAWLGQNEESTGGGSLGHCVCGTG